MTRLPSSFMRAIEYLSHTADVRMRLKANSLEELFEGALEGMNNILKEGACSQNQRLTIKKEVHVKSHDVTSLLVDFMNEVLTLTHTGRTIFCRLEVHHLTNKEIDASIWGLGVSEFDDDIKAVTYHEADVQMNESGQLQTVIIFDI